MFRYTDDILTPSACLHLRESNIKPDDEDLQNASHANKGSVILEYWQDDIILAEVAPEAVVSTMFKMLKAQMTGKALKH